MVCRQLYRASILGGAAPAVFLFWEVYRLRQGRAIWDLGLQVLATVRWSQR